MRPETHLPLTPERARRALMIHAAIYVIVNAILVWVDLRSPGETWFYWPMLGWGIGLAYHAWAVWQRVHGSPAGGQGSG